MQGGEPLPPGPKQNGEAEEDGLDAEIREAEKEAQRLLNDIQKGTKKPSSTSACMAGAKITFLAFFLLWAKVQGWKVPKLHVRICHWLETQRPVRVLMVFRGAAKSTIYAVYKHGSCTATAPGYR